MKLVVKFIYEIFPPSDLHKISQIITSVFVSEDMQGKLS